MELQYERVYESISGGWVDLHPLHGKDELKDNLQACKLLADRGHRLQLLPCINQEEKALRQALLPDVHGNKNPDVRINLTIIGDIKSPQKSRPVKKSTLTNAINSAAIQKVEIAIVNLINCNYTIQDIKKGIVGAIQPDRNRSIMQVWIITRNQNIFKVCRKQVYEDIHYDALNHL